MFDVGFTELLLVGLVALLVLGPERLPVAARTVGLWVGRIKRTVNNVQREINEELRVDEMRRQAERNKENLDKFQQDLQGMSKADPLETPQPPASSSSTPAKHD
ncbi:Sec-independent protein translocase protein TatB [Balneatrix alpica]|uniref:Sec-independent protein translocase protein TatB n=1 Tax=Balneatrix alpica TaxID=75684 RepID=A0ABV5ZBR5_9GAMM|nr:Sec-independent protein translocase protein TatB [Balneatrix alpica]